MLAAQYVPVSGMTHECQPQEEHSISRSLYVSHFISTWNSRGFEFGAVLFLARIYPGTLLPVSIYALCRSLAAIIFSSAIGNYIDRSNRLQVVRVSITGQRSAVASSCCCFLTLLLAVDLSDFIRKALFAILTILAAIEKLSIIMNTIAVERDWIVVIAGQNQPRLNMMNSQMRRIDLFCKLISPLIIAFLDSWSSKWAIIATLIINLTSVLGEYFLIAFVYRKTPDLAFMDLQPLLLEHNNRSSVQVMHNIVSNQLHQLRLYINSPAFLPSLSLSMLFLTVLSFAGQMITYLAALPSPQLTSTHIGMIRTLATICEISATFITPVLISKLGSIRAGIWSLSWQCMCLTPGVAVLWTESVVPTNFSAFILIASVILSRAGLWSFDLVAQLQVQNAIDVNQRGTFSATETSLQNFFELCAFAMTIVWSKPAQFKFPVAISLVSVCMAAICYARFVRLSRGHLFHLPPCCETLHGYKPVRINIEEDGQELIDR